MLDSINEVRQLSPLRKLLVAVLVAIVLAQAVAMAMIAHSQVRKAEWRAAAEAQRRTEVAQRPSRPAALGDGVMTVGYTPHR
ncbi:putative porin [Variovorax sp. dw_954]|uniref:putative porin n=1 Tax=Variovorax sp. dw_954 TaxID=2720078 RepID=UPI001BD6325D|nr:putative porin [Variovorax sp. dw_954]